MALTELTAISPVDGRYRRHTEPLAPYFSEEALIRYRVRIEIEYFIALCQLPLPQLARVDQSVFPKLRKAYEDFTSEDALEVKETEKTTNHDVKAVEYFVKKKLDELGLEAYREFVHFGLTSQDINNTSIPLLTLEACKEAFCPLLLEVVAKLQEFAEDWKDISMLARTHGQPASPTRLGKEIEVFVARVNEQVRLLELVPMSAKFGGATGNFNAHHVAYPDTDWNDFANHFVNDTLGLKRSYPTTQIEHYDNIAAFFDGLRRINTILIDLCRDFWTYISNEYFTQKIKEGEVGSSAMPHKVNPIDFENAEGNFGIANAIYGHLSEKLPISRLQRDLTDSTVLRNIGVPMAHSYIGFKSLLKGLNKLVVNEKAIKNDLENNWAVVAEAIQTILRREAYPNPYEALKALTRTNQKMTPELIHEFVNGLDVSDEIKAELIKVSPFNYTGI